MARLVHITALRRVRPQMATSMQPRMGTPTRTPGAAGKAQVRTLRSTTRRVTRAKAPRRAVQLPAAGEGRKRAADRRPSTVEVEVGNPERRALAARQAEAAVAAAGVGGGEPLWRSFRSEE